MVDVCGTHYLGEEGIGILQGMVDAAEALFEILLGEPCGSLDIELLEERADALVAVGVGFHGDRASLPGFSHAMLRLQDLRLNSGSP